MGFIIVVLLIFAILCGIVMFSKSQANGVLDGITSSHKIDLSFSTSSGCLAFSDSEKKIHFYSTTTHEQVAINYDSLTSCGRLDESSNLVLFNAMNPKLTQYKFGAQNVDRTNEILKKMNSILEVNLEQAKQDYANKISIPQSAIAVKVKRYEGINADIPGGLLRENTYIWVENDQIYLMSKLRDWPDYKVRPNVNNPIIIDIKNIVELSQGGEVHYTTQVHGGGGGGSSLKGAIIGGVLAGEAGAIIGSRKPIDPILSTTQKIDDRATHMKVLDSSNKIFEKVFEYNDYYVISKLMNL